MWSKQRNAFQAGQPGLRLLIAEPTPSLTGTVAQDRLACGAARIPALAQALAAAFGNGAAPPLSPREAQWVANAAQALKVAGPAGLVTAGADQPADVQAAALALTSQIGGVGHTLTLVEPITVQGADPLTALQAALTQGQVDTLLIVDTNPAYTAKALAISKARLILHAGLHADETAAKAHWHAPLEHGLETWSDARAVDGTASLIQPLVTPFYAVRSPHVILEDVQGRTGANARELVAATWRGDWGDSADARWQEALRRGFIDGSAPQAVSATAKSSPLTVPTSADALTLIVRPDPCVWDGRFANNPYLQELPKPLTKTTWGNVLMISPATAHDLHLANGDEVKLTAGGQTTNAPIWIMPGQDRRTIVAFLGYGRQIPGQTGHGYGYDAYGLTAGAAVTLAKTGRNLDLATTQPQQAVAGPDPLPIMAQATATGPAKPKAKTLSFYPDIPAGSPSWGMAIDTDVCIGCNACVSACDTENNIAMVGKDQVAKGREMHWLRVDHYVTGGDEDAHRAFQPVPCMHCEQAPCELGCPVHATVHGADGLNLQVYNRCIGTRTCSSYCPYKVRKFNWFDWTQKDSPERQAQRNPNVTVRSRGVMEKCTYCIQRISDARIQAKIENRPIADGEIKTACQQTCPTDAITFGDVSDPNSAVSRKKAVQRNYALLEEYNTRPRTTYLARLKPDGEA
jgi:Fe-S-cluster-containing dehydrogenase component